MINYCSAIYNKLGPAAWFYLPCLSPNSPNTFSVQWGKCHIIFFRLIASFSYSYFHSYFLFYCLGCQVSGRVSTAVLQRLLCHYLTLALISHLSWLHPLGVAPSEKLPWEQEEHDDFLRVGCHIVGPWSISSVGVTAAPTRRDAHRYYHFKSRIKLSRRVSHALRLL